jgi:hypothetical protein
MNQLNKLNQDISKIKQVRSFLFVFGSGIVFAFILALSMLYIYNPSGVYFAKYLLIAPENFQLMSFKDKDPATGEIANVVLDRVEFIYYDEKEKKWNQQSIDHKKYEEFYKMIENDKSISSISDEVKTLFYTEHPSSLSFMIKAKNSSSEILKTFGTMQIAEHADYYRIRLRVEGEEPWIYFYYPSINRKLLNLFVIS